MTTKPNSYLIQLRDQIVNTFDMEELEGLAFELNVDWDELQGSRKSTRAQDLVTQLAQQGRVEELVTLLKEKRPNTLWPNAPNPELQKQHIRTAFPTLPLYQQTWVWAIVIVLISLVGFGLFIQLPEEIASAIPTDTAVPTVTKTPSPTTTPTPTVAPTPIATPLPFPKEGNGETLIIIATFHRTEGVIDVGVHDEIRRTIEENIALLELNDVRVEVEPTSLKSADSEAAQALGQLYDATLIIWGSDTGVRQEINFLNLKIPNLNNISLFTSYLIPSGQELFELSNLDSFLEVVISETTRSQLGNPEGYSQFVVDELPNQISYLALIALGQIKTLDGDFEKAISIIERALSSLPTLDSEKEQALNVDVIYFGLGSLYWVERDWLAAIENYDKAIALNTDYAIAYYARGNSYNNRGNSNRAMEDYSRAIELNPNFYLPYNYRGELHERLGNYDEAIADYDKATELNPDYFWPYYSRGWIYSRLGEYEQAILNFDQAATIEPDYGSIYSNRGQAYLQIGDIEQALSDYDLAISLTPSSYSLKVARALIYLEIGEYGLMLNDLEQAVLLSDQYTYSSFVLRNNDWKNGEYATFFTVIDELIMKVPDNAHLFLIRGVANSILGQDEEAIIDLEKAIQIDPENTCGYSLRGDLYEQISEFDKAVADFSRVIELDPENEEAILQRAYAYRNNEQYQEALLDFERVLEFSPQKLDVLSNIAYLHFYLGEYRKAIVDYEELAQLQPQTDSFHYMLGLSYAAEEKHERAIENYNIAIDLSPESYQLYADRADSYFALNLLEEALADYITFLEHSPQSPEHETIESLTSQIEEELEK